MTGYDLMKQFESTLCEFWSAKHSQIYPELKKLKNNQTKFTAVPDSEADEFGDYLVLMGAIMREEMVIEWLRKCLALLG